MKNLDEISISRFVVTGIDQRARVIDILDDLQKNSLDFYAQLRSLSQQHRAAELRHGKAVEPGPSFYQDPGQDPGKSPAAPPASAGAGRRAASRERSAAVIPTVAPRCCSSIIRTSPSAPLRCSTATNSERRVASSLTVPLR